MSVLESSYPPLDIPEDENAAEFMLSAAEKYGDRQALICDVTNKSYKFNELRDVTRRISSGLIRGGLRRGDVACIILPGCIEVFPLSFAIIASGAIFSGCNPQYTQSEMRTHLLDSDTAFVIAHESILSKVEEAVTGLPRIKKIFVTGQTNSKYFRNPSQFVPFTVLENDVGDIYPTTSEFSAKEDIALMFYSSGTTGLSKGVMATHYGLIAMVKIISERDGMNMKGNSVQFAPVFHATGFLGSLMSIYLGNTIIVMPRFDLPTFLRNIEKYRVAATSILPPIIMSLASDASVNKYDLSSLKTIFVGAAPVSAEAEDLLQKKLGPVDIRQIYGLTEGTSLTLTPSGVKNKAGSVGILRPNVVAKVVDVENATTLGPNEVGELCVKSPLIMKGYWKNPQATKNTIDQDGWLHTGDMVYYDEDEYFYVVDRLKELVKYKGFQVPPAELEGLLLAHPSVEDVCVIGVPVVEAGELPKAYVVLKPGAQATEKDIARYVQDRVASYKRLRGGVEFITEIPKSATGKILRRVLRNREKEKIKSKI